MVKKLFISYKSNDSPVMAGRLRDNLQHKFPRTKIFFDKITLVPGDEFEALIKDNILKSDILLAVIGPHWLESIRAQTVNGNDFVIFEIATALQNNIKVIPVLLEDTKMPSSDQLPENIRGLTKKHAFTLHNDLFNTEIELLSTYLRQYLVTKKSYRKLFRNISFSIGALLAVLLIYFLWRNKALETRADYREILQLNSQEPQLSMNWSTIQFVLTTPKHPTSMALRDNAILFVSATKDRAIAGTGLTGFFFLVRPSTPASLFFHQTGDKLFINQKLKALFIDGKENLAPLTNAEIADLETISVASKDLSDTLFNQLSDILQANSHISVIDNLALVEDSFPQISEPVYQLMKMTSPEILVCPTSFQEIGTINLQAVKSAIIRGAPNTAPKFFTSLELPALKTLTSYGAQSSKMLLGDSTESITYYNDSTLTNLGALTNKARIKQLQLVYNQVYAGKTIDLGPVKGYKSLKSFGFYSDSKRNNVYVRNIGAVEGMSDLTISNINVKDLSEIAKKNPQLQQLTVSFDEHIENLDWVSAFARLKSLSLDINSDSMFRDYRNVQALSTLPELEYFAINAEIDRNSKQYQNLLSACPKCKVYRWGLCMGSGWIITFFPVMGLFFIIKWINGRRVRSRLV